MSWRSYRFQSTLKYHVHNPVSIGNLHVNLLEICFHNENLTNGHDLSCKEIKTVNLQTTEIC